MSNEYFVVRLETTCEINGRDYWLGWQVRCLHLSEGCVMSSGNYVAADTAFNPVLVLARAAKVLDLAHVLSSDLKVKLKYHQRADVYFVVHWGLS